MSTTILDHPLSKVWMSRLRNQETPNAEFRELCSYLTQALLLEVLRKESLDEFRIQTPLEETSGFRLKNPFVLVPILRAGIGMVDPVLKWLPEASVGYLGLERDEETAKARRYYAKFPCFADKEVLVLDPMLATGGSAIHAINEVIKQGGEPSRIRFLCMVAAPEGIEALRNTHSQVAIYSAALDRELNTNSYILPGLGDFGDRLFNT